MTPSFGFIVWHGPPTLDQKLLPGPTLSCWPVALSKIANREFAHCMYCVAPAAPLVSGTTLPAALNPRKLIPRTTLGGELTLVCSASSNDDAREVAKLFF